MVPSRRVKENPSFRRERCITSRNEVNCETTKLLIAGSFSLKAVKASITAST